MMSARSTRLRSHSTRLARAVATSCSHQADRICFYAVDSQPAPQALKPPTNSALHFALTLLAQVGEQKPINAAPDAATATLLPQSYSIHSAPGGRMQASAATTSSRGGAGVGVRGRQVARSRATPAARARRLHVANTAAVATKSVSGRMAELKAENKCVCCVSYRALACDAQRNSTACGEC
jgi:hypothetical protein